MSDSSILICLIISNDQWHNKALNLLNLIENNRIFITETILTETLNSLDNMDGKQCKMIYNEIIESHNIILIKKYYFYNKASDIFLKYDGTIGFSDCTIIQVMFEHNIQFILSFDNDFDKVENITKIYDNSFLNY